MQAGKGLQLQERGLHTKERSTAGYASRHCYEFSLLVDCRLLIEKSSSTKSCIWYFPEPVHISGEQRLKSAHERARENQASLQKDLDTKRQGGGEGTGVCVKQEPVGVGEDEPMDTSSSSSIPNGCINGYPSATSPLSDHPNGNGGVTSPSPELRDFVSKTFRKNFVLTLSEIKRLFNLHLASLPAGHSPFHSISDRLLQDTILLSQCKQILVPVSIRGH